MHKLGFNRFCTHEAKEGRNEQDTLQIRANWARKSGGLLEDRSLNAVVMDETRFSLYVRPRHEWRHEMAPDTGQRVPNNPGKGLSLTLALSMDGVEAFSLEEGFCTGYVVGDRSIRMHHHWV